MDAQTNKVPYVEIFTGPVCDYCRRAKAVLARRGLRYREVDVSSAAGRGEMTARLPHARTIPQIFVGGQHIGGCEDLERLDASGGLGLVDVGGVLQ